MAEESETGEKSEEPTSRRTSQARTEGQVARSTDLSLVTGITAAFLALQIISPYLWQDIKLLFSGAFTSEYSTQQITISAIEFEFGRLLALILPEIMAIIVIAAVFGAGCTAAQTNFLWSNKLLRPKFSQLNPVTGLKRIFSAYNMINVGKQILKLMIIGPVAYFAFLDLFPDLLGLMKLPVTRFLPYTAFASSYVFWRIISWLFVLALIDFWYQRYHTHKKLMMAKSEVKDERKAVEGDEQTKLQIRAKALRKARDRMMQHVHTADVVVTNPTHIAVALKYSIAPGSAPKVIAKGQGYVAERIKKLAFEARVPVIERKPLARALFKAVEVGQEIPYELFHAVAELLAYVFKLKHYNPFQNRAANSRSRTS